jgi:hypothetical protein
MIEDMTIHKLLAPRTQEHEFRTVKYLSAFFGALPAKASSIIWADAGRQESARSADRAMQEE